MLRKTLVALGVCLSLTACETLSGGGTGEDKYSAAALAQNLKIGVTTPQEVRTIYGKPDYTSDGPTGPRFWSYSVDENTNSLISQAVSFLPINGANNVADQLTNQRTLDVFFENNKVDSYSISNAKPK